MRYYSEKLKKFFDSEKDCLDAEKVYDTKKAEEAAREAKLKEDRKARAKEVEDAYKAIIEAQDRFNSLSSAFIKDFGSFHMTFSSTGDFPILFRDPFDPF